MPTSSYTFAPVAPYFGLNFGNAIANETDSDPLVNSFVADYAAGTPGIGYGSNTYKLALQGGGSAIAWDGLAWKGIPSAGVSNVDGLGHVIRNNQSETSVVTITYTVMAAPGAKIYGVDGLTIEDKTGGTGSLTAAEGFTDSGNNTVGSPITWHGTASSGELFSPGYSSVNVTLTITASAGSGASGGTATFSVVRQGFIYAGISIDKEISVDGTHWLDVGKGNVADNPTVFSGTPLYERVIVSNLGNMPINGATVTDAGDAQVTQFKFGGQTSIALAGIDVTTGQSVFTSDAVTLSAFSSLSSTATVKGNAVDGAATVALSDSDLVGYSVLNPAIVIDDQVSFDASTWYDQAPGVLQNPATFAGGPVYYRSIVTNTGDAPLSGVTLTDTQGETLAATSLAAHAVATSSTVTLSAVDAGRQFDTASVTGTATATSGTQTVTAADTADYSAVSPAIVIDDQVSFDASTWYDQAPGVLQNPATFAGGPVYYRSIVTNTGDAPLSGVTLTDTQGETLGATSLAAHAVATSSTVTLSAVDAGRQFDTASVTGTATATSGTQTVTAADTADYSAVSPAIVIDDQVSFDASTWYDQAPGVLQNPATFAGGPVYYRSIVTNTGDAPLSGVTLTDTQGETLGATSLAAHAVATSSTVTLSAVDAGRQFDTASVTGTATATSGTQTVTAADTADYSAVSPAIVIDDQVSFDASTWYDQAPGVLQNPATFAGGPVYYRSIVTNTGDAPLSGVTLTDTQGETLAATSLAAHAVATSSTVTLSAVDAGRQFDTASVAGTATATSGTQTVTAADTADYSAVSPAIVIDDQVSFDASTWYDQAPGVLQNPATFAGGPVYYRSIVTNTGDAPLSGVTLTDTQGETLGATSLAAHAVATSSTVTLSAVDAGRQFDTASVTGTATATSGTQTVTAADTADYSAVSPAIVIDDQVSFDASTWYDQAPGVLQNPATFAGGPVYYRSIVTNTGDAPLSGVTLTDTQGETLGATSLAAHAVATSSTVTLSAVDAGRQFDTASVTGTATATSGTQTVTAADTADYSAVSPAIVIDDQVSFDASTWYDQAPGVLQNPATFAGGPVYYRSIVTNTGDAPLSGVTLTDTQGETLAATSLAAHAVATSSTVTLSAVDAGRQFDTASVTGTATATSGTQTVTAADTADYSAVSPAIVIDDQVSFDASTWYDQAPGVLQNPTTFAGGPVYYRSIVTNTGDAPLTGVTLTDTQGETLGATSLAAHAVATSSTVTLSAVDAGRQFDTASVAGTATATSGTQTVTAADTADYSAVSPAIVIDDQVSFDASTWYDQTPGVLQNPTTFAGGPVYYRSIVTNTGDAPLTGVTLTDTQGETLGASSLAAHAVATSSTVTLSAVDAGRQFDTASVAGTATATSGTQTVTAADTADYSAVSPAIVIDDQVSFDASTWYDQTPGVLQNPTTFAGGPVYYRSIVTNTGDAPLTGVTLTDTQGETLGATSLAAHAVATSSTVTLSAVDAGRQFDTASVTGTATATSGTQTVTAADTADYSAVSPAIVIDDQVSFDASTWYDQTPGVLQNPATFAGGPVYYRSIVTNTGDAPLTGVTLTDTQGETLGASSLAAHAVATSSTVTLSAVDAGRQLDTASVAGTATATSGTQTVTAADTADYSAVSPAIVIDDQVSFDASTWYDQTPGVLQNPATFAGGPVYYRSIVTNTGDAPLTGVTLTDTQGETLAASSLAAHAVATSSTVTLSAVDAGRQLDTAWVAGTATATSGTQTVTAADTADYSAVSPAIVIDDQVSFDASTWYDQTSGVLQNPATFAGGPVYYRSIVTNTGDAPLTGVTLTDTQGETLAASSLAAHAVATSSTVTLSAVDAGRQLDTAWVAGTATATSGTQTVTAADTADYSAVSPAIVIDDQVSFDASTWYDQTPGVLQNPATFAGGPVYYRSIVTNTGDAPLTGVTLTDTQGETLGASSLAAHAVATSSTVTLSAVDAGRQLDTAWVAGTATATSGTQTVTAADTADYSAVSPAIVIDDQVSFDGTTWQDVGVGVLAGPGTTQGGPVYYRSIVTNTGNTPLSGVKLTDTTGETLGVTTLAAGQVVTSSVVTTTAAAGHGYDTASVTGTATAGGLTATASAKDTADYTALSAKIAIDDQVSLDGCTWQDVGVGTLTGPATLAGAPVYYRSIVTNTGTTALSNVALTDSSGETLGVTTLSAGQILISSVVTITAAPGHGYDTASVTGKAAASGQTLTVTATDTADYTAVSKGLVIDDQVSVNGTNWQDVGVGTLTGPGTNSCAPVYFRSIVTNTGSAPLTGVKLTDTLGEKLGVATLTAGQVVTSSVVTTSAASPHGYDTATVSGTASAGGRAVAVSAVDVADYTILTPCIAIDDQVSTDGTTWQDVGKALNNPTTGVSSPVYFRSIVTNTGNTPLSNVKFSDTSGETLGVTSLTAGQVVTSSIVTITAATSHHVDSASVSATYTAPGRSSVVAASDVADYTGLSGPGIKVTKVANVSSAAPGAPVTYSYTVTNVGTLGVKSLKLVDDNATPNTTKDDFSPTYISGDKNNNGVLDPGETWTYRQTVTPPVQCYSFSGTSSSGCAVGGDGEFTVGNGYIIAKLQNTCGNFQSNDQEITSCTLGLSGGTLAGCSVVSNWSSALSNLFSSGFSNLLCGSIANCSTSGSNSSLTLSNLFDSNANGLLNLVNGLGGSFGSALSGIYQQMAALQSGSECLILAPGVTSSTQITSVAFGLGSNCNTYCGTPTATVDTNTVSVTGTATNGAAVSGTAQASVTIGATAPTCNTDLDKSCGSPAELEFQYNPNCTVATLDENSVACESGKTPANACFIAITDKAGDYDSGAHTYYCGTVSSGDHVVADASSCGGFTSSGASCLYAHVFNSQADYSCGAAATQEICYDVSGSHAIALGDCVGSLKLVGYASTTNQGYFS